MDKENKTKDIAKLITMSLWNKDPDCFIVDERTFDILNHHSIVALPTNYISILSMPNSLRVKWKNMILQQMRHYGKYIYIQSTLPFSVPYVILKGTSAAKYYPNPQYRAMGDIDIITRREDYISACNELLLNGYTEITSKKDHERGRHRVFTNQGIIVEIHQFFSSSNDPYKAEALDDLIINHINPTHILPDLINGLTLIEHINQHMESGIGLRQIIDWMMFVDKCLSDDRWNEFQRMVHDVGLEILAKTVTRMCEIYFGLSEHQWCKAVNKSYCYDLMKYIMMSGNFGHQLEYNTKVTVDRFARIKHPIKVLKELQYEGIKKYNATEKTYFKCFAWLSQGLYIMKNSTFMLYSYKQGRKLNRLFDYLGVKRKQYGLVYFEDGEYKKIKK